MVNADRLGTAPPQQQSILGVLLRAIYNHFMFIIQLLLSGGSTQQIGVSKMGSLFGGSFYKEYGI